ncbi:MAG TPA: DUF559 domain-containing protein [Sphingomonas sp.]
MKRARELRKALTLPEVLLWQALKTRPGGHRFRKQVPMGPFVLDFACLQGRLCIEVDGEAHNRGDQPAFDAERDALLRERGFGTLRIPARDVLRDLDSAVAAITARCAA